MHVTEKVMKKVEFKETKEKIIKNAFEAGSIIKKN